jgi:hypothetical protein
MVLRNFSFTDITSRVKLLLQFMEVLGGREGVAPIPE